MSKKLPYFQFEPAEYLTGNIQFCSLAAQGLFVNIQSIYWQRDCNLTVDHLNRLFKEPELIDQLVKENIIKVSGKSIKIGFLDIQFEEITERKNRLSIAGKKGARAKKHKATLKPPLSDAEATLKQPDKIKEDKIREDILNNYTFIESQSKANKLIPKKTIEIFEHFWLKNYAGNIGEKTIDDIKDHFGNWLPKNLHKEGKLQTPSKEDWEKMTPAERTQHQINAMKP